MDNKYEKCGGELVEGSLAGNYMTRFYPKNEEKSCSERAAGSYAPAVRFVG